MGSSLRRPCRTPFQMMISQSHYVFRTSGILPPNIRDRIDVGICYVYTQVGTVSELGWEPAVQLFVKHLSCLVAFQFLAASGRSYSVDRLKPTKNLSHWTTRGPKFLQISQELHLFCMRSLPIQSASETIPHAFFALMRPPKQLNWHLDLPSAFIWFCFAGHPQPAEGAGQRCQEGRWRAEEEGGRTEDVQLGQLSRESPHCCDSSGTPFRQHTCNAAGEELARGAKM